MPHFEIKPVLIRKEYTAISMLMRRLHESEKELFDKTDDWDEIENSYMRHAMETQEECNGTCLLAYVEGQPVAFIFGYEDEDGDSRIEAYSGKDLYVSDGYVLPEHRRAGLYQQMNEQLEAIYIALGVRRILRFTLTSNTRMQGFLARQGYQPVRYLYEKWLTPDGKGVIPLTLTPPNGV